MRTVILVCLASMVMAGCAGLVAPFVNNRYAGTYSGTFTTSDGRAGPASITLTNIGNVFGTLTDTKTGVQGSINGSVGTNLVFNGTVSFASVSHNVSGTFTSKGNEIQGVLTGTGYSITLDVNK